MARRTGFYLDKRSAKLMGVCSGLADYTGFDVLWMRVGFVLGTLLTGGWLLLAYLVVGLVADKKPQELYLIEERDPDRREFWRRTRAQSGRSVRDIRSSFRDIDRRLADMETRVTSQNSRLAREIDELRNR